LIVRKCATAIGKLRGGWHNCYGTEPQLEATFWPAQSKMTRQSEKSPPRGMGLGIRCWSMPEAAERHVTSTPCTVQLSIPRDHFLDSSFLSQIGRVVSSAHPLMFPFPFGYYHVTSHSLYAAGPSPVMYSGAKQNMFKAEEIAMVR
jgi:hypothetical protein